MNALEILLNEDVDTSVWSRRTSESATSKSKTRTQIVGRRRGKSPQQFNGMHRRRTKKIRW